MAQIRSYRPTDQPALASICLRTAAAGDDATGVLADDEIWANMFVLPYVARAPDLAWVLESDDGRPVGYLVGSADSAAFDTWFRDSWWPRFARRWPEPAEVATRQDELLRYAYGFGSDTNRFVAQYPAHLHIDLLPEARAQGWGRRLMEAFEQRLRERAVNGIQIGVLASNSAALAFYERLGFSALTRDEIIVVLGKLL